MFADAQAITGPVSGTNVGATMETNEYNYDGILGASVWFTYTPIINENLWIDTCQTDFDTVLVVWENPTGLPLNGVTPLAVNDDTAFDCSDADGPARYGSQVRTSMTAGVTYLIQVGGYTDGDPPVAQGNFTLNLFAITSATNDNFANAQSIIGSSISGSNFNATMQPGEYDAADFLGIGRRMGASVWFRFTALTTEEVTLNTCDSLMDTVLVIWKNPASLPLAAETPLAENDDAGACESMNEVGSQVRFLVEQGETYYVQLGGFQSTGAASEGTFTLAFDRTESVDTGDQTPPMWMQSMGRPADGLCDESQGWVSTWEQWMNDGAGGPTCYRVIAWYRGAWAVGNNSGPNGTFAPVIGAAIDQGRTASSQSDMSKDARARK
jgi:hypothetical protein